MTQLNGKIGAIHFSQSFLIIILPSNGGNSNSGGKLNTPPLLIPYVIRQKIFSKQLKNYLNSIGMKLFYHNIEEKMIFK